MKLKKDSGESKKSGLKKKTRSVHSLIAKNRKVLQKLKPSESSEESEPVITDSEIEDEIDAKNNKSFSNTSAKDEFSDSNGESDQEESMNFDEKKHKKSLANLKDTDPEFYNFLEENDKKLLQFDVSDSESDGGSEEEKVHQPPEELEVDSDEDDFADGEEWKGGSGELITLAMVSDWQKKLQSQVNVQIITEVVKAFQAALQTVSGNEEADQNEYRVDGSSVFNAVIRLCVMDLQPALFKLLNLHSTNISSAQPSKSKRWNKVKYMLKNYLTGLLKLLGAVSSSNILTVLLKHLHQMTVFFGYYHSLTKTALKQLVTLWSTSSEETVRVVAFLCILRITTNQQKSLLDSVLKMMYVAYISNSKFISLSTLPNVTFMRRSLAELFSLDAIVSYQHAFLYIRQLAIHLRNAITVHKKESIQAVCNWQYMNSLRLWVDLICSTEAKSQLRALLYPLVQVIIGCIKLVSTARYIPLRFHCCQLLIKLSQDTGVYIPILPFIVESLTLVDFNKKHKKLSIKPMDFTCILRVNNTGLGENGFKDAIVENVYQLLMEYCAGESHRISFPDVIVPAVTQLRSFVKECHTSKYSQKLRQACAKIEESAKFTDAQRRKVTLSLGDMKSVVAWEDSLKAKGTPLTTFYESWHKVHQRKLAKQQTDNDKLGDFNIPQVKKPAVKKEVDQPSGPVDLFPSDSENDSIQFGDEKEKKPKRLKMKKEPKITKQPEDIKEEFESDDSIEDVVEELRLSDLE